MHGKDEVSPSPHMKYGQRTTYSTAPGKVAKEARNSLKLYNEREKISQFKNWVQRDELDDVKQEGVIRLKKQNLPHGETSY